MNNYRFRMSIIFVTALTIAVCALFAAPETASAATLNEITAMHDAGIPPEIIIEVIEATGIDEKIDEDMIIYLWDYGVDQDVIEFIIEHYLPDEANGETRESSQRDESLSNRPNYAGGQGFSHSGNPNQYWEGSYYESDNYWPQNLGPHGVTVYEPPVYIVPGYPYRPYQAPRLYRYNRGYWDNGRYVIYDNNYGAVYDPNAPWYNPYYGGWGCWGDVYRCHDRGWGANFDGSFYYDGRDSWFDGSFDSWYRDDRVRIRFNF